MTRLDAHDPQTLTRAADVLRSGGVVAYPTDTLYGLGVDPRSDDAVERLFRLKGRDRGTAVPIIASGLEQAQAAGEFGPRELRLAEAFWPGPLSIVVPAARVMSRRTLGGRTTIAVRVPSHPIARGLASAFGFCVTATSANLSGAPATSSPDAVAATLGQDLDVLLDAGAAPGGQPSTLVAFDQAGPVLIRAGAIAWERVLKSLE